VANNSDITNAEFTKISELLGIQFETVNGFDRIDEAAAKINRNLKTINQHLPAKLLYRPNDATFDTAVDSNYGVVRDPDFVISGDINKAADYLSQGNFKSKIVNDLPRV
jgi:hypothetical protein